MFVFRPPRLNHHRHSPDGTIGCANPLEKLIYTIPFSSFVTDRQTEQNRNATPSSKVWRSCFACFAICTYI
jgi:hypothetical protein